MKQLTLLRHAKAVGNDATLPDIERPLSARGTEDIARMSLWLREKHLAPDQILSSPATRAKSTAEGLLTVIGETEKLEFRDDIYLAEFDALLDLVRNLDDACQHVLLVGHNPGFTELWNYLSMVRIGTIPTCGAFSLALPVSSWREVGAELGRPLFMAGPRELGDAPEKERKVGKKEKEKENGYEKKGGCRHGKSEAEEEPGNFKCKKCGAVSAKEQRLCKPAKIKKKAK